MNDYYVQLASKQGPYTLQEALAKVSEFVYVAAKHRDAARKLEPGQSMYIIYGFTSVEIGRYEREV